MGELDTSHRAYVAKIRKTSKKAVLLIVERLLNNIESGKQISDGEAKYLLAALAATDHIRREDKKMKMKTPKDEESEDIDNINIDELKDLLDEKDE